MNETPGRHESPERSGETDEGLTLEARLQRLDEIVAALEAGDVDLDNGLRLFEEGVRHIRASERLITHAELRVEELIGDGETTRFEPSEVDGVT